MPIETRDAAYGAGITNWTRVRDCFEGEDQVKSKGARYLREFYPGMRSDEPEKWQQYLRDTAEFPNVTQRVHSTFMGALLRTEPQTDYPESFTEFVEDQFGTTNTGLHSLISEVISEDLLTGRTGILVDRDAAGIEPPYPVVYSAESIVGAVGTTRGGDQYYTSVRLSSMVDRPTGGDMYNLESVERILELGLDENEQYFQRVWIDGGKGSFLAVIDENTDEEGRVYPLIGGQPMNRIPFWIANSCIEGCKPILTTIAQQNVHLYRKVSIANHNFYLQNTPTYLLSGFTEDEEDTLTLGGLIVAQGEGAALTVVDGAPAVMEASKQKIAQAFETLGALGATMFSPMSSQAESGIALKIRNAPDSSIIGMEAAALSTTLSAVLRFGMEWYAGAEISEDIQITLFNAVDPDSVDPQILRELIQGAAEGTITSDVLFYNLNKADALPPTFDPIAAASAIQNNDPV